MGLAEVPFLNLNSVSRVNIIITRSRSIMEINSLQKQREGHFEGCVVPVGLPFSIRWGLSRRGRRYERDGHWNERERLKYSVFLSFFRELLQDPVRKKRVRVYDMMADMIVTRNSNQCRSHHQKMEKYRASLPDIVASVAEKYEPNVYKELSHRYLALIKTLLENADRYKRAPTDPVERHPVKKTAQTPRPQESPRNSTPQREVEEAAVAAAQVKSEYGQAEEGYLPKKELRRTADEYEEGGRVEEEELPMMPLEPFSDDPEPQPYFLLDLRDLIRDPLASSAALLPLSPSMGVGYLDAGSRFYYEQQLGVLQLQRQWHVKNAEQLYGQWSSEVQSIKFCEESIQMYSRLLAQRRAP